MLKSQTKLIKNRKTYLRHTKKVKPVEIEYEGRILDINPVEIREKAKSLGGHLKAPLTLYRRSVFKLCDIQRGFARVRDEGDKVTMTAKIFKNPDFPEEYELQIKDGFESGQAFLRSLNLTEKAYHETIREKWFIPRRTSSKTELCELTIDYIPGLPAYSEIECKTQADLRRACKLLGFKYSDLLFGGYGNVFTHYYGMATNDINNEIPSLTFQNIEKELDKYIHKNKDMLAKCAQDNLAVYKLIDKQNKISKTK
jgi:adenylate cyclase class 2